MGFTALICAVVLLGPSRARALDKQGSAHGGGVAEDTVGRALSGSLLLGAALHNRSYAARPDNSGLALMRYAGHADVDLVDRKLSIPIDVNLLSDRERTGGRKLSPCELDLIVGLTSTWSAGSGAVEFGSRIEHDRALDRSPGAQSYGDVRARYLFSLARSFPGLARALADGDVRGWGTLGWFAYNRSYFARPDNSGLAFLRYALHAEVSLWGGRIALALDGTSFTDRHENPLRPSELDLTPEIIVRLPGISDVELHLACERDMPVDSRGTTPGYVQQFWYATLGWNFRAF